MRESEILQALDRIYERSRVRTIIYGRLGRTGDTPEAVAVRGRPGYYYVSMGEQGDQGISIAKDQVGIARKVFQRLKMRRELGELVIYEAAAYDLGSTSTLYSFYLRFSTDITEPPASGDLECNNASQSSATKLWLSFFSDGGADIQNYYTLLKVNDEIYAQEVTDSSHHQLYTITGTPVLKADYVELPVTWKEGTSLVNNQRLLVSLRSISQGGGGGGGGDGVTSFFALDEVDPNDWDNGEVPTWDVETGTFKPMLPGGYGEGGGAYLPGNGIQFSGNVINVKPNTGRGIIVDSTGVGVFADPAGGIEGDVTNLTGLRINRHATASGLVIDSAGVRIGKGDGITVSNAEISVDVSEIFNPNFGLADDGSNRLKILLGANSGLAFVSGDLVFGDGDGLESIGSDTKVKVADLVGRGIADDGDNNFTILLSDTPPAGLDYGSNGGIRVGEGNGIQVFTDQVGVKLSSLNLPGMTFDANGGMYIGDGDGINVKAGEVAVDVVELISPLVLGIEHDGQNNFAVALEANSGLRYNAISGRLELGAPGDLTVYSESVLIDDTHYHHVATSSDPGSTEAIMATDLYGGFIFDTNLLIIDAANDRVGINTIPENLDGAAALDIVVDNLDDITQRLRQKEDQRGRIWRVEDYTGQELIVLDSVGNLQSGNPGFVSGMTGWQITHTGNAEFNNIWARGELHATVFVKDEIHATGGTFMVATAATFFEDSVISSTGIGENEFWVDNNVIVPDGEGPLEIVTTSPTFEGTTLNIFSAGNFIKLNHPPSGPATYFQPGEILRVKTEINEVGNPLRLADVWLVVNQGDASNEEYGLYSVTKVSGSDCTIPKGTAIVTYGREGDGAILMTSDWRDEGDVESGEEHTPYIDIFTTGHEPWTGLAGSIIPHIRLGQLSGSGIPGISGISRFGLLAGPNLHDPNSSYFVASGEGVDLYRGVIRMHNGANLTGEWDQNGNFKLGKNVGQKPTRSFEVVTSAGDDEEGDVWIGDRTGTHYLHWDASAGTLLVTGSLQIGGGSGYANTDYVDGKMAEAVIEANDYTDQEIGEITGANNTYADSRRMVAVDGTWTSAAYNKVGWASAKAYFANNTTRTITNSVVGGITLPQGRTYLYVDLNQVGNLTIVPVQSAATLIQPSYVVIAVVDVGTSAANSARASINIVVGSTYISGANIFTGSILASNIAANAIDTGWLAAGAVTANEIDVNTLATINGTKIQRIEGVLIPATRVPGPLNSVSWGGVGNNLRVTLASGVVITVSAGSRVITGLDYAYVLNRTSNATVTLLWYDPTEAAIDTLPANAVIIAVCQSGAEAASAVMVTGGVIISGSNIVADSITAGQIKANSLTADLIVADSLGNREISNQFVTDITDDATAGAITATTNAIDADTIIGMNGKIAADGSIPTPVVGRFSWPLLTVKYKTGRTSTIAGSTYNMVGTASTTRAYFSIDPDLASTAMVVDETLADVPAGNVIIAVGERQTVASSVTMVYGGVVISGNSIVAGSITGTQIQAETITTDHVVTNFFASSVNDAFTQATADVYKNTIVGCSGNLVADPNTNGKVTWPQLTIKFANNTTRVVPASTPTYFHTVSPVGARGYFWVVPGEPASTPLWATTTLTTVPADGVIIGVAERGETHTTITMTFGGVLISGNHIQAGSITGGEIQAGSINGDRITTNTLHGNRIIANTLNVNSLIAANLQAVRATTGNLTVDGNISVTGTAAKIFSTTKSTFASTVAGFFLGYDGGAYKLSIGDAGSYFKWDGTKFTSKFDYPLTFIPNAAQNNAIFMVDNLATSPTKSASMGVSFDSTAIGTWFTNKFLVEDFVQTQQLWIEGQASSIDAIKFDATLFSTRYQNRFRYTLTTGLMDWDGVFYAKEGIVSGLNLDVQGNVIRLRTPTNDLDHSTNPGSIGDIRWGSWGGSDYLYVHFGAGGWRRVLMGGVW